MALGLLSRLRTLVAGENVAIEVGERTLFTRYCDTLMPRDAVSPSASDLGVDVRLAIEAGGEKEFSRLIARGVRWLDQRAAVSYGSKFSVLSEEHRTALVEEAAGAPRGTAERQFFERTRNRVFALYYAQHGAWPSLQYAGPPQPLGFPDYTQPPSKPGP